MSIKHLLTNNLKRDQKLIVDTVTSITSHADILSATNGTIVTFGSTNGTISNLNSTTGTITNIISNSINNSGDINNSGNITTDGIIFILSNNLTSPLNFYKHSTITGTFNGNGKASDNITMSFVRIGNIVNFNISTLQYSSNELGAVTVNDLRSNFAIPAEFQISDTINFANIYCASFQLLENGVTQTCIVRLSNTVINLFKNDKSLFLVPPATYTFDGSISGSYNIA